MKVKFCVELDIDLDTEAYLMEGESGLPCTPIIKVEQSILNKVNKAKCKFFKSLDKQMLYYDITNLEEYETYKKES